MQDQLTSNKKCVASCLDCTLLHVAPHFWNEVMSTAKQLLKTMSSTQKHEVQASKAKTLNLLEDSTSVEKYIAG